MVTKRDREVEKGESSSMSAPNKGKLWVEDQPDSGGMDELLEVLGYKVRSTDMAEVAQKLEELEMAMGSGTMEDGISLLSNDTVHFNPADLSGWVQSMLCEINNNLFPDEIQAPSAQSSTTITDFPNTQSNIFSDHDLRAIPGDAIFGKDGYFEREENKRMKSSLTVDQPKPVVVMDSQETGVRLVHALMACAEAVQQDNLKLADALLKHIGVLAVSQAGAMRKVATYFAEGLARRIYKIYPQDSLETSSYSDDLEMHFYETCPYLKFAHFTANQAILEAFSSASSVHVVDFSLKQGMQWPALIQALAVRKGGPPTFRLTGIGPPQPDNNDAVQQVGWKLSQLAGALGVHFEFRGFVTNSLADLDADMLDIRPTELETVAVNSVFELHRLLANPGHIEKVLALMKAMRPKIVTVVEQEANHNGPLFLQRFNEALHYYCTMFDSLESSGLTQLNTQNLLMSEMYLGKQICNVVASEGTERVERHEPVTQWRTRMSSAGFESVHLGSNAFKQASMLLAVFNGGGGYRVEEKDGCLMLDWQTRPLISTVAFQLAGDV